jgi:hypothetical protein
MGKLKKARTARRPGRTIGVTESAPMMTSVSDTRNSVERPVEPAFVLCAGRSGSTLLRFLLDAHPDLACPPETNVPAMCGQLATVWSLIEGAPLSANRGDEPPDIPAAAIAGVRETMNRMIGSYLTRRQKKRYCDKSLGTARFAYLMTRVWPDTKFICLYRHPMDVIASGMEACPWGLNGYGFEPYIAETPGNAVFALARFWADNASAILAAEEQFSERCHRVRYEDMVTDPQAVADSIFAFLGVDSVPGIAEACFAAERERFGPADYKIWHTSHINAGSVGRGWAVPSGLISPQACASINQLCGALSYVPVDGNWGTAGAPGDLRLSAAPAGRELERVENAAASESAGTDGDFSAIIGQKLKAGLSRLTEQFAQRWAPCSAEVFELVCIPHNFAGPDFRWRVDLSSRQVTLLGADTAATGALRPGKGKKTEAVESDWDIIGSQDLWQQVLSGQVNMSVALRCHQLRYCEEGERGPIIADTRMGLLADLLGIASWGQALRGSPHCVTASPGTRGSS